MSTPELEFSPEAYAVKILHPVLEVWNSIHMKGHSGNWEGRWLESLKLRLWNGDASWTPRWAVKSVGLTAGQFLQWCPGTDDKTSHTSCAEVMPIGLREPKLSFPWRFYPSLPHGWDQTLCKRKWVPQLTGTLFSIRICTVVLAAGPWKSMELLSLALCLLMSAMDTLWDQAEY